MNRDRVKQLLPIIQAFAEGKNIEYYLGDGSWVKATNIDFSDNLESYRIKPEPEVIYVNCLKNNIEVFKYPTRTEAIDAACVTWSYDYIAKKFIEAIE